MEYTIKLTRDEIGLLEDALVARMKQATDHARYFHQISRGSSAGSSMVDNRINQMCEQRERETIRQCDALIDRLDALADREEAEE